MEKDQPIASSQPTSPGAVYLQDPAIIQRQQGPPTGDLYAQPEKLATHRRQSTELPLATYQDPDTIQRQIAPASGDLYALPDKQHSRQGGVYKSNQVNIHMPIDNKYSAT